MKDINFLGQNGFNSAEVGKKSTISLLIVVLLALVAVGGKVTLMRLNVSVQNEISEKEAFIKDNNIIYELEGNIEDYNVQLNKTKDLISRLAKANTKNSEVFETLGQGMPDKIYIGNYSFTDDRKVVVLGFSPTKEEVAQYTWGLKQLNVFKNVLLDSIVKEVEGDNSGERFKYQFTVEL